MSSPNPSANAHRRSLPSNALTTPHGHRPTGSAFGADPGRNDASSHPPSEATETTVLGPFYDGGKLENTSSVTFQDGLPCHRTDSHAHTIPPAVVPALFQGVHELSPSPPLLDEGKGGSRNAEEGSGDSGDAMPRYSMVEKGKWSIEQDSHLMYDSHRARSPSPYLHLYSAHNSVDDWVVHNRPVLQDYADRQVSLPLGNRLEVSISEPSRCILGALHLLVNRDQRGCTDRSRRLGPQLIENFVDIDRWAKEYFRSRHGVQTVDSDISTLLTIVLNNFYEGQVQLVDRLVEFALENMHFGGRKSLAIEDFAFGFDFRMSQDLPFYVETSSRIREPLPIPAVDLGPLSEPVVTSSGRQVKPSKRAQAAAEAHASVSSEQNRDRGTSDKQGGKGSTPVTQERKSPAEPCAVTPIWPNASSQGAKYQPIQPSTLGLSLTLPDPSTTPGNTHPRLNACTESKLSTPDPVDAPKVTCSRGSNVTTLSPPRLKIVIAGRHASGSTAPATSESGSTLSNTVEPASSLGTRGRGATRSRSTRARGRRNGRGRGHERGNSSLSTRPGMCEGTDDSASTLPTLHRVGADGTVAPVAVNASVAPAALVDGLESADGMASGVRPCCTPTNMASRGDGPSMSQCARPGKLSNDAGHGQGKKRTLDDSED